MIVNKRVWNSCHISGKKINPGEGAWGLVCLLASDKDQKRNIYVHRDFLIEVSPNFFLIKNEYKDIALKAIKKILSESGHDTVDAEKILDKHLAKTTCSTTQAITEAEDWFSGLNEIQEKQGLDKGSSETWKIVCKEIEEAIKQGEEVITLKNVTNKLYKVINEPDIEKLKSRISTCFGIMAALRLTNNTKGKYKINKSQAITFLALPEKTRIDLYKETHHAAKPNGWSGRLTPKGCVPLECRLEASKTLQALMKKCNLEINIVNPSSTEVKTTTSKLSSRSSKLEKFLRIAKKEGYKKVTLPNGTTFCIN